jgi:Tfp pilus assembly protein PilX
VAVKDAVTGIVRSETTMSQEREETMRDRRPEQSAGEGGFALILAILALMLLTTLGLALATTTSTELQIATNYRWSQQALYNAEAGVEAGKAILRTVNWASVLPAARTTTPGAPWSGLTLAGSPGGGAAAPFARNDEWGNPTRNFENSVCDKKGFGMGYGVVLDDGGASAPYQYVTTPLGQNLNGAFTLWIRRPLNFRTDAQLDDYSADSDNLILVSEGIAPFTGGNITTAFGAANRSVQVIEVSLGRVVPLQSGGCGSRGGQMGGSALGAGFGGCDAITGGAGVTGALAGAPTGTGAELNPNQ